MCNNYHYVIDNEGISYEVKSVGPKCKIKLAELQLPMATLVNNEEDEHQK